MSKWKQFLTCVRTHAFQSGLYAVAVIALVLAILIGINRFAGKLPTSVTEYDLTTNKKFTLSQQSKDLIDALQMEVELYWIAQAGTEDPDVEALLDRYAGNSPLIHTSKIDPDLQPTFVKNYPEELNNNGVLVVTEKRYCYVDVEDIYVETYDNNTYSYVYTFAGEHAITSAIDYVTSDTLPTLVQLTGHGETPLSKIYKDTLTNENILIVSADLSQPVAGDMLLINQPTGDITSEEAQVLSQFLEGGGDLILLSNASETETFPNLYGLMEQYGMQIVPGIVFEPDSSHYYYNPNELLPQIYDHPITTPVMQFGGAVLLPDAQGIRTSGKATGILSTSQNAYSKTGVWPLSTSIKEEGDLDGPFAVGAVYEEENTHVLWVTSGYLLHEDSLKFSNNLDLFMNTVNHFAQRENRITIRPKPMEDQFLVINAQSANTLKLILVGVIPVGYLAIGIYIFFRRKRK